MENEFVNYEQALALKELGYNEPCFATGFADDSLFFISSNNLKDERHEPLCVTNDECIWEDDEECINGLKEVLKPTKSQVFKWFREKYEWYANISSWIHEELIGTYHEFEIYGTPNSAHGSIKFKTYEEAENVCIDKLIEIAKQK